MRPINFDQESTSKIKPVSITHKCENGTKPEFCDKACSAYSAKTNCCLISCKYIPMNTAGFHMVRL